jgi:hypothetical protein
MSQQAKRLINDGTGVYQMSRSQAGEAYRAAKKLEKYEISYWNRNRKNQTKTTNRKGVRRK